MPKTTPLTDAQCRQSKFVAGGNNKLFDGGGLHLALNPSGSKTWRMKYRFNGNENLLTFGSYPAIGLAAARKEREEAKQLLAAGIDPALQREIKKQINAVAAANTFQAVAEDWLKIKRLGWSKSHDKRMTAILTNDLFPLIGKRPIADITGPVILATIRKIEGRGAHEMAAKALEACGGIFRHAGAIGAADRNPVIGLRASLAPRPPVKHYPRVTEAELPTLLERIDRYHGKPETVLALKIMNLTFLRTSEMIWAKWDEFDFEKKEWHVPAQRMKGGKQQKATGKPHIVPLARQTIALLDELRNYSGRYPLLFPSTRSPAERPISTETTNKALKILGFEGKQTGHGFRGLASTIMNKRARDANGHHFHPDTIEIQLAHVVGNQVRRAYNDADHLEERHQPMQWWADYIDQKSGKNIVRLNQEA
jgi:integrase